MSGSELAARLEVDARTVRRYITIIQDLGVPVDSVRGRHGYYQLRTGFRMPPLLLTDDEVLSVVVGLLTVRQSRLAGDPAAIEGALAKIERVLPEDLRSRVRAVSETLVLDIPASDPLPVTDALSTLITSAHQETRVRLRHASQHGGEETEREVDPYGLVHRYGHTYLAGYCHLRRDIRVFRLDRVTVVERLAASLERPEGFDALAHVLATLTSVPRAWSVEVLLAVSLEEAKQHVPAGVAQLFPTDGGTLLKAQTEDLNRFCKMLVWIDLPFTVVDPPELRDAIQRLAGRLTEYATYPPKG